jgi:hypothetical protein
MFLEEEKAGMMVGRLKLQQFKNHQTSKVEAI